MTRYRLRFPADGEHAEEVREFDKDDGSFVFWLTETIDGREIEITANARPLCSLRRSRANKDFWIIGRPSRRIGS